MRESSGEWVVIEESSEGNGGKKKPRENDYGKQAEVGEHRLHLNPREGPLVAVISGEKQWNFSGNVTHRFL